MNLSSIVIKTCKRLGFEICRWPHPQTLSGHLKEQLSDLEIDAVIDVGANRGQYGLLLRKLGYKGLLISFEPNPEAFADLRECSSRDDLWEVHQSALGDENGTLTLRIPQGNDLASALALNTYAEAEFGDAAKGQKTAEVLLQRLDDIFLELQTRHHFSRPFLKLDTQGFDLRVLGGAQAILSQLAGLQTEIAFQKIYDESPSAVESIAFVGEAGFDITGMFPIVHDHTGALIEVDCVAKRRALE